MIGLDQLWCRTAFDHYAGPSDQTLSARAVTLFVIFLPGGRWPESHGFLAIDTAIAASPQFAVAGPATRQQHRGPHGILPARRPSHSRAQLVQTAASFSASIGSTSTFGITHRGSRTLAHRQGRPKTSSRGGRSAANAGGSSLQLPAFWHTFAAGFLGLRLRGRLPLLPATSSTSKPRGCLSRMSSTSTFIDALAFHHSTDGPRTHWRKESDQRKHGRRIRKHSAPSASGELRWNLT